MRQFIYLILIGLLLRVPFAISAEPPVLPKSSVATIDRIVAVVNKDVITLFELNDRLRVVSNNLTKQGIPLPESAVLQRQLLERMVSDLALSQYAAETGVRVDDSQLDRALQRIAAQNNMDLAAFRVAVERDGISFSKFREEIRSEIISTRVKEREVDNKIFVSEDEIDNYLKAHTNSAEKEDEFYLAHILIKIPEQASPEQIQAQREKAEQALAELKKGANFSQVAASFSDAPDGLQGGTLGWRSAGRLPSLFVEVLAKLNINQTTDILRSANGFHILKLLDRRGKTNQLFIQQTHARHILIKTNEAISEQDAKKRAAQIKERLDHGAQFEELARLHSEDTTAIRGGDLGWISPGDTVPEFERAMELLKPSEVSDLVKTNFGWHIIQVIERRTEDVSVERQRLLARQEVRARKSDEAYLEWLRQLRDRAFVEIKLDES